MSDIRLTTPEGFFEESLRKTMAAAEGIGRSRKAVARYCAALAIIVVAIVSIYTANAARERKEYLALQAEIAELDIFLEVNR